MVHITNRRWLVQPLHLVVLTTFLKWYYKKFQVISTRKIWLKTILTTRFLVIVPRNFSRCRISRYFCISCQTAEEWGNPVYIQSVRKKSLCGICPSIWHHRCHPNLFIFVISLWLLLLDLLFLISELRSLIYNQWYKELISHEFIVTIKIFVIHFYFAILGRTVRISMIARNITEILSSSGVFFFLYSL